MFVTAVPVFIASRFRQLSPRDRCSAKKSDNATCTGGVTFRYSDFERDSVSARVRRVYISFCRASVSIVCSQADEIY